MCGCEFSNTKERLNVYIGRLCNIFSFCLVAVLDVSTLSLSMDIDERSKAVLLNEKASSRTSHLSIFILKFGFHLRCKQMILAYTKYRTQTSANTNVPNAQTSVNYV